MYLDTAVAVPDAPGKLTFREKAGTVYVYYEYDRSYDAKKKYNVPKRTTIGKLVDPDDRTTMYPNTIFATHFPTEVPEVHADANRSGCLRMGTWAVIDKIAREYQLGDMLSEIIGGRDGSLVLDLAAYSIVTEGSAAQHYPAYAYTHPLHTQNMHIYGDSKISDLLNEVGRDAPAAFMNRWNANRDHRERIWISYDSTNKKCVGDLALVEPGHSKTGSLEPIVNYAMAYDRTNSEPLFYEGYPGSIVDVSQLQLMLEKARSYGYHHAGFILDRGYFFRANIAYMDECSFPFVMMVKGRASLVNSMIEEVRGTFETSRECAVKQYHTYGTTLERPLYAGDAKTRYFHLFHSSAREATERESLKGKLERMEDALVKSQGKEHTMSAEYARYYEAFYDGETFLFAREKADVVERELKLCGYFAIVTSEKMTAKEALLLYKSRDASEKLFTGMKSFLGVSTLRVHADESVQGKLFCEFVALIIRNRMHVCLSEQARRSSKKTNFMTVPAAIGELEKIEMLRQADGIYRLDHAVTATQKEILAAFGLDEDAIKSIAAKLGRTLEAIRKEG